MSLAVVFPGQGSQRVGMGKAIADAYPEAAAVFAEVDEALGENLSALIFGGPEEALTLTRNTQPALMAVSLAVLKVIEAQRGPIADYVSYLAGHSLGEYAALAAAGSLTLADTARLLRLRGDAMQRAVPAGEGAMAAILGLDPSIVREVAEAASDIGVCEIANDNGGGQVVVSGAKAAVERAAVIAKERGAARAILLQVSAPFHCRLMAPAAEEMAEALARVTIADPAVPVVTNVSATPVTEAATLRRNLVEQVTGRVRWRESVEWMAGAGGVTKFFEIGSGKVLSGLIKRIAPAAETMPVGTPDDIAPAVERLS